MTQKTAKDAMTPISQTFSVDVNATLDLYGCYFTLLMSIGFSCQLVTYFSISIYAGK
jgi:metal transporter CNNM